MDKKIFMFSVSKVLQSILVLGMLLNINSLFANYTSLEVTGTNKEWLTKPIIVEFQVAGIQDIKPIEIPLSVVSFSVNTRITFYRTDSYQVVIHEIRRGDYIEINLEFEHLNLGNLCGTLRITIPYNGDNWEWFRGLDKSEQMKSSVTYYDTVSVNTVYPPDGAFNGKDLADGGYGDPVGQGTMSYYPLCAARIDDTGHGLGIDMSLPVVYRLGGNMEHGLFAEFDLATNPITLKFPNRAFFRLCKFDYNPEWGMRAALKQYYLIYPEIFKKRVINEGIWLPFVPLRSISGWSDFGFAFHETSWGRFDQKDGKKIPNIQSDKETGVYSFQYTEPWDIQLPIKRKKMAYATLVSDKIITKEHKTYLDISATEDKNGLWQARRLRTPWFNSGWAVSITTNCDPDLFGFNRYHYILQKEISPALKLNVDGIYFDSMEWNWHHDLNYREHHFAYTDYPLTYSKGVCRPAIWNFTSEFEFMKKIADEMHSQGKLAMGNGHDWNPFAAANLDLFGAEISWHSLNDHNNSTALDFKRIISFQKPIVFLLNHGLNKKAFTKAPYKGYEIYFEKMMAYGFFPSFFSVNASDNPYWKDPIKIENGRPFFKKYIPIIKQIAEAGWEPVTAGYVNSPSIRIERFGAKGNLFFTIRNNTDQDNPCTISLDIEELGITGKFSAFEMVGKQTLRVEENRLYINIPAGRTQVIQISIGD